MALTINPLACPQNHRCPLLRVCSAGAISQNGYGLPVIDKTTCIECGKCARFCPMQAVVAEADVQ
ncbi:MAG: 4Fe-4S binding protein [Bacteroidota bacterium]|nr:4Fe-4S binding protein [Bacteroidota bacterium]